MSLAITAVRGAIWTIGTGIGTRLIGVVGTILLARLLAPDVIGEVLVATALVMTATLLSHIGFGHYVVAKKANRAESFHATVFTLGAIAIVFLFLWIFRAPLSNAFDAPTAAHYIPWLVVGAFLQRIGYAVSRVLVRDLKFRAVAIGNAMGELAFPLVAVGGAWLGWGGDALVVAFVLRGALQAIVYIWLAERREWLEPCKLSWTSTVAIFRFGIPLWVASIAHFASRQWDNLLISRFFSPFSLGIYNYAYNLADIPASQIGEHIGDVLLPSFANIGDEQRRRALTRATTLMALMVFPLAVGLGAVSETLTAVIFNQEWQGVGPVLLILSALSIVRPVGWTINSYLVALHRVGAVMYLEIIKLAALMAAIVIAHPYGLEWVCVGVGVGFATNAIASIWLVRRADRIAIWPLVYGMVGPLLACVPMVGGVLGARWVVEELVGHAVVSLAVELVVGGIVYIPGAFIFAPSASRDAAAATTTTTMTTGRALRPNPSFNRLVRLYADQRAVCLRARSGPAAPKLSSSCAFGRAAGRSSNTVRPP